MADKPAVYDGAKDFLTVRVERSMQEKPRNYIESH